MFPDPPIPGRFRLFLMRHGHLENSDNGSINGQFDVSLSLVGERQMELRAKQLAGIQATLLISSTLLRTKQSLELFARTRPDIAPLSLEGFKERSFGSWEGKTRREISEEDPKGFVRWQELDLSFAPNGGESLLNFKDRINRAMEDLILEKGYGHNAILIAHSGVNRILLLDALGADLSRYFRLTQAYGALNVIDYTEGGEPTVLLMNHPPEDVL